MPHDPGAAVLPDPRADALAALRAELAEAHAARLRAEAADAVKEAFLARLGHEWRTPLGAITAAADVLDGVAASADPLAREARDVIRRQARLLAGRIDEVLDATRVIGGRAVLTRWRADLAELARRAVAASVATGQADHCELRLTCAETPVDTDSERVVQAILHLLSNALRCTPPGGEVGVEAGEDAHGPFVRVSDTGSGIQPREGVPPFDAVPASGIGLRFVTALMPALGGGCDIDTGPGGTAVTLRFAPLPSTVATGGPASSAMRRVLLVDVDGSVATAALRRWLEHAGHRVTTAVPAQALASLAASPPDLMLVVLDTGPDDTGPTWRLGRQARAAGHAGRMVGLVDQEGAVGATARRLLVAGFDGNLVLPLDPVALQRELAAA